MSPGVKRWNQRGNRDRREIDGRVCVAYIVIILCSIIIRNTSVTYICLFHVLLALNFHQTESI